MKTLTLEQFQALSNSGEWMHQQAIEDATTYPSYDGLDDIERVVGEASVTSVFGELKVKFLDCFTYDVGFEDSFEHRIDVENGDDADNSDARVLFEGFEVVGENGVIDPSEAIGLAPIAFRAVEFNIDYSRGMEV